MLTQVNNGLFDTVHKEFALQLVFGHFREEGSTVMALVIASLYRSLVLVLKCSFGAYHVAAVAICFKKVKAGTIVAVLLSIFLESSDFEDGYNHLPQEM